MQHIWDFSPIWENFDAILDGLRVTFLLTLLSCSIGAVAGLGAAVGLTSKTWTSRLLTAFVELIRACPPLVMLIWMYYLLPSMTGVGLSPFSTATIVFALTFAAFSADVFRGSIEAIPPQTLESGITLGMSRSTVIRRVLIPEVFRRSFPAVNALVVSTLKMSSLASVIAVNELTYNAALILQLRPRPFEVYTAIAVAYCSVILPIVFFLRWLERQPWLSIHPSSND
jgi:polar amino acid transport system permease protein